LSAAEVTQFRIFGFLVLRSYFSPAEVARLDGEFTRGFESPYAGMPFDGTAHHWALMTTAATPFYASLLEDPRFVGVAEQLYGVDVIGVMCDANRFIDDTIWHADTPGVHHYGLKFTFYLQPLRADAGALRVVPGSHARSFHEAMQRFMNEARPDIAEIPAYVFESQPGDVIAYDLRLWHASLGGFKDRRHCSLFYFNDPKTPEERAAMHEQDLLVRAHFAEIQRSRPHRNGDGPAYESPMFDATWLENREGSQRRARWIQRLRELGFFAKVEPPQGRERRLPRR
jgi:hypothetical protein